MKYVYREMQVADLPEDLQPDNYAYPAELLADRLDGSDSISVPLSESDQTLLMAKYAVAKALRLNTTESRLIKLVRGEESSEASFMQSMRKVRNSLSMGDLEKGDIELKADELGVLELIWPFDPEKMKEAEEYALA